MENRIPELDGVRGIAILLVVLFHDFRATFQNGWLGVDIFFVLSGFLITSLLIAEHSQTAAIDFKTFYLRRARRLLPAVAALLGQVAVVNGFGCDHNHYIAKSAAATISATT